jgi:hypothetical protein
MVLVMLFARRTLRALVVLVAGWASLGAAQAAEQLEYAVKAAYLTKFAFYVDWPPQAFTAPTAPVVLCVLGDDPFGNLLDEAAAGQSVQGHPIAVRRMKVYSREAGCHIVYVVTEARAEELRSSGALVVADAGSSGIINFVVKDNRVRFTVDDDAASRNGLSISSRLLAVALAVKPRVVR